MIDYNISTSHYLNTSLGWGGGGRWEVGGPKIKSS